MENGWVKEICDGVEYHKHYKNGIIDHECQYGYQDSRKLLLHCTCTDKSGTKSYKWFYKRSLHRENGPAILEYKNDFLYIERWYNRGKLHRYKDPAWTNYSHITGEIIEQRWYNNGLYHRDDGPAYVEFDNNVPFDYSFYSNGRLINDEVDDWLKDNEFGIPVNYRSWTDEHKMIFKLMGF